jgi:ElaB/YqjD/DUF883 family membrane-anchored ribosome-binding protein
MMPNQTSSGGQTTADDMKSARPDVAQRARDAKESLTARGRNVAETLDDSRSMAADGLDTAASTLHDSVDNLPGGDSLRLVARATADRLSDSADYIRSHDAKRMMADIERFVKGNPGPALVVAAVFGFLLGRSLSRD